ncbi:hypothetical protein [Sulfidibacter corallicola]|uniref:Uncharacterized protein n=1 Tax=Sulfidibacter corallicola TaxID=2818388 RepID=A0A8A4TL63_SULCO|nr:hypothetical protein [Sulfidibacter corallicola]QTD49598.1 hypothetical protein J3U87_28760 [Sulfidibacter corallicola]
MNRSMGNRGHEGITHHKTKTRNEPRDPPEKNRSSEKHPKAAKDRRPFSVLFRSYRSHHTYLAIRNIDNRFVPQPKRTEVQTIENKARKRGDKPKKGIVSGKTNQEKDERAIPRMAGSIQ